MDLFWGFAGQSVLFDGQRVVGVRTGDRGVGKDGKARGTFEPGADIQARSTIFADGVRGHLTKELMRVLQLGEFSEPAQFAIGLKELWEVPRDRLAPGTVIHTLGYPLRQEEFGGSWLYAMPEGRISIGFVVGLDYQDPLLDPFSAFQRFKQHPFIARILAGGQVVRYGAKALPEGGWNTQPRLFMDGGLIVGDAANFVNSMRLKGIHLAMRSGMLAAETAFEALGAGDTSARTLSRYKARVDASAIKDELYPVRGVHQAFAGGLYAGSVFAGLAMMTGGRLPGDLPGHAGHTRLKTLNHYYGMDKRDILTGSNAVAPDRAAHLRQAHERALLRHSPRGGPAGPPAGAHGGLPHHLRRGVWPPVRALLSRERLRDGGQRAGRPPPADQRVELRALQDVRHHGSLRRHHLGGAGRRRRAAVRRTVRVRARRRYGDAVAPGETAMPSSSTIC